MKNICKRFHFIIVLLALFVAPCFVGCSDDDDDAATEIIIPEKILTQGMTFGKTGGTSTLSVKSNVALEVTSSAPEWCVVTAATSASSSILKYSITTTANPDTKEREAIITIKSAGSEMGSFTVKQIAADGLIIESSTFPDEVAAGGGNFTVKVRANGEVEVASDVVWITRVDTRAMEEQTFYFTVQTNSLEAREGNITFTQGSLTETIKVKQADGTSNNMSSDATTLAAKLFAGINIGNSLESCNNETKTADETSWGNPKVTAAYINGLKASGFNAVRIPCAWDYYIINPATYEINPTWLNRVSEVVGYCVANDMYVIVNIHWDGGWLEANVAKGYSEEINAKQKALWTQIANKLNAYDEHLLFAGCNEPGEQDRDNVNASAIETIVKYEQTFIDAVRATGGNNATRNLIVQGPYANIDRTVNDYKMPVDKVPNRLMVEAHFYEPYQFSLMEKEESWGKVFYYWGEENHVSGSVNNTPSKDEEAFVKQRLDMMKKAYVDKGIPVILGEYSARKRTQAVYPTLEEAKHKASRAYWNEVVTREAKNNGCVPFYWETGEDMNRANGQPKEQYAIDGIMKGAQAGKYPF